MAAAFKVGDLANNVVKINVSGGGIDFLFSPGIHAIHLIFGSVFIEAGICLFTYVFKYLPVLFHLFHRKGVIDGLGE